MQYLTLGVIVVAVVLYVRYAGRNAPQARPPAPMPQHDDSEHLPASARSLLGALQEVARNPAGGPATIRRSEDGQYSVAPRPSDPRRG